MGSSFYPLHFNVQHDFVRLIVSMILGAVIGLEREVSNKAAGLRTNTLICMGACLYMVCSRAFTAQPSADPTRIAAQIVSGVGFLGAGAIMRDGEHVMGLTTAATIWMVAAIGMAVGGGELTLAAIATLVVLFVQLAFTPLDTLINDWQERHMFRVISKCDENAYKHICHIFESSGLDILRRKLMKKGNLFHSEWYAAGSRRKQEKVMQQLVAADEVIEVTY